VNSRRREEEFIKESPDQMLKMEFLKAVKSSDRAIISEPLVSRDGISLGVPTCRYDFFF
jgi:hypothetical protein